MEEIKQKLLTDEDHRLPAFVVTGLVSKIYGHIIDVSTKNEDRLLYLELLNRYSQSANPALAHGCVDTLVKLERGVSDDALLRRLLSYLPTAKWPGAIVSGVGQLLQNLDSKSWSQHPFVIVLRSTPGLWPWVASELPKLKDIKRVLLFVFCDPNRHGHLAPLRESLTQFLSESTEHKQLLEEILCWTRFDSEESRTLALRVYSDFKITRRLPFYVSLATECVRIGADPTAILDRIETDTRDPSLSSSSSMAISLLILTSTFEASTFLYYEPILKVATVLFDRIKMKSVLAHFVNSLMIVMSIPSKLVSAECWKLSSQLLQKYYDLDQYFDEIDEPDPYFLWDYNVNDAHARYHILKKRDIKSWISHINECEYTNFGYESVVRAIILGSNDLCTVEIGLEFLRRCIDRDPRTSAGPVLTLVMHKLGLSLNNPEISLALLKTVPYAARDKGCVGSVAQIINSLSRKPSLNALRLRLLRDLWRIEDRCYPFLYKALEEHKDGVDKAEIIRSVCFDRPTRFAEDLLPFLSAILNRDLPDCTSVMALESIYVMCKESVIDLRTTIKVLEPKIFRNGTSKVLAQFCRILSLVPIFDLPGTEYRTLVDNTAARLWSLATSSDLFLRSKAVSALLEFKIEHHKPEYVPTHKIKVENDQTIKYLSGDCWIRLVMENPHFEPLIMKMVANEVQDLPRANYFVSKERMDYSSLLKDESVLNAVVNYLLLNNHKLEEEEDKEEEERMVRICLKTLGQRQDRALPTLDWTFLNKYRDRFPPEYLAILIRQAPVSSVKSTLQNIISHPESRQEALSILNEMDRVIHIAEEDHLTQFFNYISSQDLGKECLESLSSLSSSFTSEPIFLFLESMVDTNDETNLNKIVRLLPMESLDRLSNPSCWWIVTESKLMIALSIRKVLALSEDVENPLTCFNDCIEAAVKMGISKIVIDNMKPVLEKRRTSEMNLRWILELMGQIRSCLRRNDDETTTSFTTLFSIFRFCLAILAEVEVDIDNNSMLSSSIQRLSQSELWSSLGLPLGEWFIFLLKHKSVNLESKNMIRKSLYSFKYFGSFNESWNKLVDCISINEN